METGFRSPLLDTFRRREVAPDIRMLAALGVLAPRAQEQLALLILLTGDDDPEIAAAAEATLASIPRDALAAVLARPETAADVRTFLAARGITGISAPATTPPDAEAPLVDTAAEATPVEAAAAPPPAGSGEDDGSVLQRIAGMNVAQRMTLAMKGSREERAILVRDPNKIVAAAVLSSPKLTDTEVESIARMANVSEDVLRIIASTRAWVKNYQVVVALTKNPKTPVAISMNMLPRLNDRDLRMLSTDRNVPDVLRVTARKKLVLEK